MKMNKTVFILISMLSCLSFNISIACTAFIIRNNETFLVGRNYDYRSNQGVIMINPRNMEKIALPFPNEVSARWISKYGSVTLNAIAREEPIEGINEKGLMIAGLWLNDTKLPEPDSRPATDDLQWIQYMLDNCVDINEVISECKNVRISNQSQSKIHYFLSDAQGNFAIIEFIDGKFLYFLNDNSTNAFICNDPFEKSSSDLKKYVSWGGAEPILSRFEKYSPEEAVVIGAEMIKNFTYSEPIESYAFNILKKVEAPKSTPNDKEYGSQWSVVYDCKNIRFSFKTLDNKEKRTIDLKTIDFDNCENIKALSISNSKADNIYSQFNVFSPEENLQMFKKGVRLFYNIQDLPPDLDKEISSIALIPYTYKCVRKD